MSFVANKKLIQHNFDGYKLAPHRLNFVSKKFSNGVKVTQLKEQFSYQHVRAFSLHNHLFGDPWLPNAVYWCTSDVILCGQFYPVDASLDVYPVYHLPVRSCDGGHDQLLNVSMYQLNNKYCLFSDGCGNLELLDKSQKENWRMVTALDVCSAASTARLLPFLVTFTKLNELEKSIELVTMDLQKGQDENQSSTVGLRWFTITFHGDIDNSQSSHTILLKHTFTGSSMPLYTAIFNQSLFVISEAALVSTTTAAKGSETDVHSDVHYGVGYKRKHEAEELFGKRSAVTSSGWYWVQSDDDITITVHLPHDVTKRDITCIIDHNHLVVGLVDGTTYIRNSLTGTVDPEASTWIIDQHRLEVTLEKQSPLGNWPMLLSGMQQIPEGTLTMQQEDLSEQPNPLVMENILEECDLTDEDAMLMVFDCNGKQNYKCGLGGRQILFTTIVNSDPPMFCVRHDIDALLWQPMVTSSAEEFPCQHVGTVNALGYVQASKTDKKFINCSSDMAFAAICDCTRNVHVYLQPAEKSTSALQYVHSLSGADNHILGLQATTSGLLFVLTNDELTVLKIISV